MNADRPFEAMSVPAMILTCRPPNSDRIRTMLGNMPVTEDGYIVIPGLVQVWGLFLPHDPEVRRPRIYGSTGLVYSNHERRWILTRFEATHSDRLKMNTHRFWLDIENAQVAYKEYLHGGEENQKDGPQGQDPGQDPPKGYSQGALKSFRQSISEPEFRAEFRAEYYCDAQQDENKCPDRRGAISWVLDQFQRYVPEVVGRVWDEAVLAERRRADSERAARSGDGETRDWWPGDKGAGGDGGDRAGT